MMRAGTSSDIIASVMGDLKQWEHQCHAASLHLIRSGELSMWSRVARGYSPLVQGQHSWVVLGDSQTSELADVYDPDAVIIDPTLWSYTDTVEGIWYGTAVDGLHIPHGAGTTSIPQLMEERPRPASYSDVIRPDMHAYRRLSVEGIQFLAFVGGLDARGWIWLMQQPMSGWPSKDIIELMLDTPQLAAFVPIDLAGMLTDRNPSGLYLEK